MNLALIVAFLVGGLAAVAIAVIVYLQTQHGESGPDYRVRGVAIYDLVGFEQPRIEEIGRLLEIGEQVWREKTGTLAQGKLTRLELRLGPRHSYTERRSSGEYFPGGAWWAFWKAGPRAVIWVVDDGRWRALVCHEAGHCHAEAAGWGFLAAVHHERFEAVGLETAWTTIASAAPESS